MASPGNQHCASCIGTLSFPIGRDIRARGLPLGVLFTVSAPSSSVVD